MLSALKNRNLVAIEQLLKDGANPNESLMGARVGILDAQASHLFPVFLRFLTPILGLMEKWLN